MFCEKMELLRSTDNRSIGIKLNSIGLSGLLKLLEKSKRIKVKKKKQNIVTDDAYASFEFEGHLFEITTPLSDYWIDQPDECPDSIFRELISILELK